MAGASQRRSYALAVVALGAALLATAAIYEGLAWLGGGPVVLSEPPAAESQPLPASRRFTERLPWSSDAARLHDAPAPPSGPTTSDLRALVASEVSASLDADRSMYAERCWNRNASDHSRTASLEFAFNIALDASGREIARGVSSVAPAVGSAESGASTTDPGGESRSADSSLRARGEVQQCLAGILDMPVRIAAPGQNVEVTVLLRIP